jgi:hypothetical protein
MATIPCRHTGLQITVISNAILLSLLQRGFHTYEYTTRRRLKRNPHGDTSNLLYLLLNDPFGPTKTSPFNSSPFCPYVFFITAPSLSRLRKTLQTRGRYVVWRGDAVFEVLDGDFSGSASPFVTLQDVITSDRRCGETVSWETGDGGRGDGDDRSCHTERINVVMACNNKFTNYKCPFLHGGTTVQLSGNSCIRWYSSVHNSMVSTFIWGFSNFDHTSMYF